MIIKHELPRDAVGIQCDCQAGYQQQGDELRTHRGVSKTVNAQYRHCVHNCTGTWSCTVQHSPATPLPKSFRGTAHVIALVPLHVASLIIEVSPAYGGDVEAIPGVFLPRRVLP